MEKFVYSRHFTIGKNGNLHMDGADLTQIAKDYGTPAYVMSEAAIRENCRAFVGAMQRNFGDNFKVAYASKAFGAAFIYPILQQEKMHADVVSGGELYTALKAGFPAESLHFHGNSKTDDELEYAVKVGIGSMVIDNFTEISRLDAIAGRHGVKINTLFRVKPGVEAHTHESIQTGQNDSKFGFGIADGEGMKVARAIHQAQNLNFRGIHCHIGSQIFGTESFDVAADKMISYMADIQREVGCQLPELILGGGFGVRYMPEDNPVSVDTMIDSIAAAVRRCCDKYGVALPEVVIEPGRSMVGETGATIYTVQGVKDIKDARRYVLVDGGMTDNPRFALYQAQYDAVVANKVEAAKDTLQTIAGRCCESGDMVSKDVYFQKAEAGDILCVFTTGAYNYAMASNYNRVPRPPVVLVRPDGTTRLVVRRETYEDITACDII